MIRQPSTARAEDINGTGGFEVNTPRVERRNFLRRFKESMSVAALRERPTAIAAIHVEGIFDVSRIMDSQIAEQAMSYAIRRLPEHKAAGAGGDTPWFVGQLSDSLLVLVIECRERDRIEELLGRVCDSLREPVDIGNAVFHLVPHAGVAILGMDGASPKLLLNHARAAAAEARRAGARRVHFFSDTVRMRSLARLDIIRELHDAVENRNLKLRYFARRDLATGALVAAVGYIRWSHPLRGEVRPGEFLGVAETTGLATALSRSVMRCLRDDCSVLGSRCGPDVRVSFGPLRQHILHDDFLEDITSLFADGSLSPDRLELRINERSLLACEPNLLHSLARLGVRLIVDEVGRGTGSFNLFARAPLIGIQLDRKWVQGLPEDPIALKVCGAGFSLARALGLTAIAHGVERAAQHDALLALGCNQGIGDHYGIIDVASEPPAANAARRHAN